MTAQPSKTREDRSPVHEALKQIADQCDGAVAEDGRGFSKFHAKLGHHLADRTELTDVGARKARRLVYRYRRQVPFSTLAEIFGDVSMADVKDEMG